MWFQEISIPPPWRELQILEGWGGGSKAQEIPEGREVDCQINFQMVQFDSAPTYLLENCYLPASVEHSEVWKGFQKGLGGLANGLLRVFTDNNFTCFTVSV